MVLIPPALPCAWVCSSRRGLKRDPELVRRCLPSLGGSVLCPRVVFILSSLCIMGKAIHDLATKLLPEVDDFLFSVSIVSGLVCVILAIIKFMLGKVLTSRALITDGFNSMVGGIMGFSILISAEVFKHEPKVWYLDGTIGVIIGLVILAYGVKLLKDMVPRVRQTRNYERFE
ncbi:hypothetical protein WMY93_022760 [Mugilogobius chulae]|uniref:Transmembrane protein 163 n=1 Tax=Mugilogobius chulae TaxID=88201 RepID=A0AAW0N904_9GOBI